MIFRKYLLLFILIFTSSLVYGEGRKIRFIASSGMTVQNSLLEKLGFSGGGALHLAYPVSSKTQLFNVELAIANWYTAFPVKNDYLQLLRFGFGIRVFFNHFTRIRPYFTHDICSHIVWKKDREGFAPTFGILLGLGIDLPFIDKENPNQEVSSFFMDVSYNHFKLRYFELPQNSLRFLLFSCGFSWKMGQLHKREK